MKIKKARHGGYKKTNAIVPDDACPYYITNHQKNQVLADDSGLSDNFHWFVYNCVHEAPTYFFCRS